MIGGLVIVVIGQGFRIAAMWTAASNFSHRIEYQKRKEHVLVTHGVYRFVRHPSYLGWFAWIVGSQMLLGNPLCAVGYTIVAWGFFRDRIPCVNLSISCRCCGTVLTRLLVCRYEEHLLLGFFPDEYPAYKARTISGVPFVG